MHPVYEWIILSITALILCLLIICVFFMIIKSSSKKKSKLINKGSQNQNLQPIPKPIPPLQPRQPPILKPVILILF
jgi:predicted PurR-regulated permease PerM